MSRESSMKLYLILSAVCIAVCESAPDDKAVVAAVGASYPVAAADEFTCACHEVPSDDGVRTLQCKCKAKNADKGTGIASDTGSGIGTGTGNGTDNGIGSTAAAPSPEELQKIGEEAFYYSLPLIMTYNTMYGAAVDQGSEFYKAPFNTIYNEHRVYTYNDTAVVTPNSDTPYSYIWMDLRAEPIVLTVPPVESPRYYSVMLCDSNTYNFGYIGSRATGNDAASYLISGPDWRGETPAGVKKAFRSGSPFGLALYRTQLFNPDDMPNVIAVQNQYVVQPLSAFLKQPAPPAPPNITFPFINASLEEPGLFEYLDFLLPLLPTNYGKDLEFRHRLGRIGVGPYKEVTFQQLPPSQQKSVVEGVETGKQKLAKVLSTPSFTINGWRVTGGGGDLEYYGGDWFKRAVVARAGIFANDAAEAVYPNTHSDGDGQPLDGHTHNYTLTFSAGSLPPANSFWSVTMYDGSTQMLVKNPINRYLINSPMLPNLVKNPDGSLTVYIQNQSPSQDKTPNWLPAPDGPLYLVMRVYWPKETPPSILPAGFGAWRPPPIVISAQSNKR